MTYRIFKDQFYYGEFEYPEVKPLKGRSGAAKASISVSYSSVEPVTLGFVAKLISTGMGKATPTTNVQNMEGPSDVMKNTSVKRSLLRASPSWWISLKVRSYGFIRK